MSNRLQKILHPEGMMGLREVKIPGLSTPVHMIYDAVHKCLDWNPEEGYSYSREGVELRSRLNASQNGDYCITYKFKRELPPIYHVGKDFAQALSRLDTKVPTDLLPEKFFAYFSFGDRAIIDCDGDLVQGVYVFIGPPNETPLNPKEKDTCAKVYWAVYYTSDGKCASLLMDLKRAVDQTFRASATAMPLLDGGKNGILSPGDIGIHALAMNLVLYVNSVDCDLELVKPLKEMKPAVRKERTKHGQLLNLCTLPITFVSWNYQKPKEYNVDSAWVDKHMRWQRCGPALSQVKLIWVREHERHYAKNTPATSGAPL